MSKHSESHVCSKFISPALVSAEWNLHTKIGEEVSFTKGRIIVCGKLYCRGKESVQINTLCDSLIDSALEAA